VLLLKKKCKERKDRAGYLYFYLKGLHSTKSAKTARFFVLSVEVLMLVKREYK
jgi:hypothetical protein